MTVWLLLALGLLALSLAGSELATYLFLILVSGGFIWFIRDDGKRLKKMRARERALLHLRRDRKRRVARLRKGKARRAVIDFGNDSPQKGIS